MIVHSISKVSIITNTSVRNFMKLLCTCIILTHFVVNLIFSKKFGIFPIYFFSIETKINELHIAKLIWSRNSHWNKTSKQKFHKITHNTVILPRRAIKSFALNFLYISKVLAFLDYIVSLAKARGKIKSKKAWTFSIKRKFLCKNLKHCEPK